MLQNAVKETSFNGHVITIW